MLKKALKVTGIVSGHSSGGILAAIPNCEKTELKSGHDIHYEHPDVFIGAVDQASAASN